MNHGKRLCVNDGLIVTQSDTPSQIRPSPHPSYLVAGVVFAHDFALPGMRDVGVALGSLDGGVPEQALNIAGGSHR